MPDKVRLTLYGRIYCHLCDDMEAKLRALQSDFEFQIDYIDIDTDPALVSRFGSLVPVLMSGEFELCHYFLDEATVRAHLTHASTPELRANSSKFL